MSNLLNKTHNISKVRVTLRDTYRWQEYANYLFYFFNFFLTYVRLTTGQYFLYSSYLPRYREYEEDFFRNIMWDIMDDPAPMETILTYIRRYGSLSRFLLMRIYFHEAKKNGVGM